MDTGDLSRLEELFHQAAELPPVHRGRFLDENCQADPALREQIERLLSSDSEASEEFLQPAARPVDERAAADPFQLDAGDLPRIGRYSVVRKIGEGGMGVVYEARQEHPSRTVALKIVRPGVTSPGLFKRFNHEAHILGQLQHPGIACIYEAGVAEVHRSSAAISAEFPQQVQFFAMEYINGEALTAYAVNRNLSTADRLELFARVCDAVQHAHQKGVIHRDLKPVNILVVDESSASVRLYKSGSVRPASGTQCVAMPKILDFGVARLTDADVQAVSLQTDVGQLIGTVPYMSPEQVLGDARLLDVRSDVYALGVILYELLTGRLPLDLSNRSIPEASRMIREQEPSRLSSVDTRFRGDIETIVAKALEKDRERRYGSAADLAADVRRFLRHEPILARPTSSTYRFRKFVRRNKILVAATAVIFVVLVAGIIGTSSGWIRATREAEIARRESAIARAVTEFLNKDLLAAVAPEEQGKDVGMRQVLDEAAKRIEGRFPDQPEVEAAIRATLGETYVRLGVYDVAETQLAEAHDTRVRSLGPEHEDTRTAARWLAVVQSRQGRYEEAERALRVLLEQDRLASGPEHENCMTDMHELGLVLSRLGRLNEAERMHRDLLEIKRRVLGEDDENTLLTLSEVGSLLLRMDRFAEAEPIIEETLVIQNRVHGVDSPFTLYSLGNLAVLKRELGRLDESESDFNKLLDAMQRVFGPEHPYTLFARGDLVTLYQRQGRLDDAERLGASNVEALTRALGEDHLETLITMEKLAQVYAVQHRWADAEALLATLVERAKRTNNAHLPDFLRTHGRALIKLARYDEAETTLIEAVRSAGDSPEAPAPTKTVQAIVDLYEAWDRPEQAAAWRSKLPAPPTTQSGS